MSHKLVYGADELHFPGHGPVVQFYHILRFPRAKQGRVVSNKHRTTSLALVELHPFLPHSRRPSPTGRSKPSVPALNDIITII